MAIIDIHIHNSIDAEEILSKQNLIIQNLQAMANEIENLTAEVAETKGIMASAKTLIEGFADALEAAGTDKAKLDALREDLSTGSDQLAAAITNNPLPTEPTPEPPTEPTEPTEPPTEPTGPVEEPQG